jgi:DNA-directed RNA polymerase specialized sigma24 family protein
MPEMPMTTWPRNGGPSNPRQAPFEPATSRRQSGPDLPAAPPGPPPSRAALWATYEDEIAGVVGYHSARSITHPALAAFGEEDLAQELRMAIWEECDRFNPNRASFPTFADRITASTVASLIRRETAACRDNRRNGPALNTASWSAEPPAPVPAGEREAAWRQWLWREDFLEVLPPPLRSVAQLLALHSELRVSQLLGLSRPAVRDCIVRIARLYEDRRLREVIGDFCGIPDK